MHKYTYILWLCLALVFLAGCGDEYENSERRSIATLKDFIGEFDHGDLISDSDDANGVIADVHDKLGMYFTEDYSEEIERAVRKSMKDDRNFQDNPVTITFFLTNTGDGFRFSKGKISSKSSWLTKDDKVWGVGIYYRENKDNPGMGESNSGLETIILKKENRWNWKIDGVE